MTDYWVAFRIKDERRKGRESDERLQALVAVLEACGSGFWHGDTNIVALRTHKSLDALSRALKATVDPKVDWVVVGEIGGGATRYIGHPGQGFLAFFWQAKRV